MPVNQTPVAGFKSTELWVSVGSVVAFALGQVPQQYAPLVAAIVGVYSAGRTLLKVVHAMGYAKQIPDLPAAPTLPPGTTVTSTTVVPK
jgi:hypothetical protein